MAFGYQSELNIETTGARQQFTELLDFAIDSTLSDATSYQKILTSLDIKDRDNSPDDSELVDSIGRLGLWSSIRVTAEGVYIEPDVIETVKYADRALLPIDPTISRQIEAFGQSLIEETFACLGEEAADQAAAYRGSTSRLERADICDWLVDRLFKIGNLGRSSETVLPYTPTLRPVPDHANYVIAPVLNMRTDRFYHPARLSPKFIGRYPNIDLEPSCLEVSILAASFFEKAAVPYMHCGVARTAIEITRSQQIQSIENTARFAGAHGITLPFPVISRLALAYAAEKKQLDNFIGFHAATIAYLDEETWFQVDPNYQNSVLYSKADSQRLNQQRVVFDINSQFVRGMEGPVRPLEGYNYNTSAYVREIIRAAGNLPTVDQVDSFLASIPPEAALESIYKEYIGAFFDDIALDPESKTIHETIEYFCSLKGLDRHEYLQDVVYGTLLNYVFTDTPDGTITTPVSRCHADPQYRRRRAEDLVMAPIFALLGLQSRHGNAIIEGDIKLPHCILDCGLPAYRIGVAVLSDFASYCGDELPLSFWLTYWPSSVCFAEHFSQSDTRAQRELRQQVKADISSEGLKYRLLNDIVFDVHE